jgi:hypothetical protein
MQKPPRHTLSFAHFYAFFPFPAFFTPSAQRNHRADAVARPESDAKANYKKNQLIHISTAEATSKSFVVRGLDER